MPGEERYLFYRQAARHVPSEVIGLPGQLESPRELGRQRELSLAHL